MAFFNLIVDPRRYDGSKWDVSLEVVCPFQIMGPDGQVMLEPDTKQKFSRDAESGVITAKLYAIDPAFRPASWYYRARLGSQSDYTDVPAGAVDEDVYLDLPTSPGVPPPGWEERLRALEAGTALIASPTQPEGHDWRIWFQVDPDTGDLLDILTPDKETSVDA